MRGTVLEAKQIHIWNIVKKVGCTLTKQNQSGRHVSRQGRLPSAGRHCPSRQSKHGWMGRRNTSCPKKKHVPGCLGREKSTFFRGKLHGLGSTQFHVPLDSLFKVLFVFPLRYSIAFVLVLSSCYWAAMVYFSLYNKLNHTCVSIGCYLRSIGGQTHKIIIILMTSLLTFYQAW